MERASERACIAKTRGCNHQKKIPHIKRHILPESAPRHTYPCPSHRHPSSQSKQVHDAAVSLELQYRTHPTTPTTSPPLPLLRPRPRPHPIQTQNTCTTIYSLTPSSSSTHPTSPIPHFTSLHFTTVLFTPLSRNTPTKLPATLLRRPAVSLNRSRSSSTISATAARSRSRSRSPGSAKLSRES